MRRFVHSVLVLFICVVGIVPCARAADWKMAAPRIVQVSSRADLRGLCGFTIDLYACTAFVSRNLVTTCVASDDAHWRIAGIASMTPVVYLWDTRVLGHERLHIRDIEGSIGDYLVQLGLHRYNSESNCRDAAAANTAGFARQVDIFAAASNARWH